jgi:hypothetical protein
MKNSWGCSLILFEGSNSKGFAREAMKKGEELQWRVRERERAAI